MNEQDYIRLNNLCQIDVACRALRDIQLPEGSQERSVVTDALRVLSKLEQDWWWRLQWEEKERTKKEVANVD